MFGSVRCSGRGREKEWGRGGEGGGHVTVAACWPVGPTYGGYYRQVKAFINMEMKERRARRDAQRVKVIKLSWRKFVHVGFEGKENNKRRSSVQMCNECTEVAEGRARWQ
jgi:hypothetical protein